MPINNLRHGMNKTRFHKIWIDMKGRCYSKSKTSYKNYGLKGIKVCDDWHIFENFMRDMLDSYNKHIKMFGEKQTTLDRINVFGDYSKNNCRWSTYTEQANNRTNTKLIKLYNKEQTLPNWCREMNMDIKLVGNRYYKLKWNIEKALTTKKRKFNKLIK